MTPAPNHTKANESRDRAGDSAAVGGGGILLVVVASVVFGLLGDSKAGRAGGVLVRGQWPMDIQK